MVGFLGGLLLEDETATLFVLGNGSMGRPLLKDKKSSSKPFFHKYSQHFQKPSDICCIAGLCINMFANAFMSLVYAFLLYHAGVGIIMQLLERVNLMRAPFSV